MNDQVSAGAGEAGELPAAIAGLVGDWQGDGVGAAAPGDPAGDFRFGQRLTVAVVGPHTLSVTSRSWPLVDDAAPELSASQSAIAHPGADNSADPDTTAAAVMTESGFLRFDAATGAVELLLASITGVVTILYGEIRADAAGTGAHLELVSDVMGRTATAPPIAAEKRLYSRRGDVVLYAVDQAGEATELSPRASAALHLGSTAPRS